MNFKNWVKFKIHKIYQFRVYNSVVFSIFTKYTLLTFADKGLSNQSYGFSSSPGWMWELDHKDNWTPKNWCFWTLVLEKTLESPFDSEEIKPDDPKGNQSWIFIGRTDAEAEAPILWPPDAKSWLIRKDPDAGKDWRQEEKELIECKMVGWHHWLNGCEFEQAPGMAKDREAWSAAVHGVAKSWTQLSDWTTSIFTNLCNPHHNQFWNIFLIYPPNSTSNNSHYPFPSDSLSSCKPLIYFL